MHDEIPDRVALLVRKLIGTPAANCGLNGQCVSAVFIEGLAAGKHNIVARARLVADSGEEALRALRLEKCNDSLEFKLNEARALRIAGSLGVAPRVYGMLETPPALICEWIDSFEPLPPNGHTRLLALQQVAKAYRRLHTANTEEEAAIPGMSALEPPPLPGPSPLKLAFRGIDALEPPPLPTVRARFADFISTLQERLQRSPDFAAKKTVLPRYFRVPELELPETHLSLTQLSPGYGNLVLRANGKPIFLDWDTARFQTDPERDMACFLAVHGRTREDISYFLGSYGPLRIELVAAYLEPVALWSAILGGVPLPASRIRHLERVQSWVKAQKASRSAG